MYNIVFFQLTIKFVILALNGMYYAAPFYFVYLDSWIKRSNPTVPYTQVFWASTLYDFGIMLANYVIPRLQQLIGLRLCLQLAAFLAVISCWLFYQTSSVWTLFLAALFGGTTHQFFSLSVLELLSQTYPDKFLVYMGRVFSSGSACKGLFNYLTYRVINPQNLEQDSFVVINGTKEFYFGEEVRARFLLFLLLLAGVSIFGGCLLSLTLKDPTFKKSQLARLLGTADSKRDQKHQKNPTNLSIGRESNVLSSSKRSSRVSDSFGENPSPNEPLDRAPRGW